MSIDQDHPSPASEKAAPAVETQDPLRAVHHFLRALSEAQAAGQHARKLLERALEGGKERNFLDPELAAELMLAFPFSIDVRSDVEWLFKTLADLGALLGGPPWKSAFATALKAKASRPCTCATCTARRAEAQTPPGQPS